MIEDSAYLESVLDEKVDVWYNEGNDEISERTQYEENPVYLSRQYTIKTRKRLIFKDFLGSLRAIYYPFTTFENLKN